MILPVYCEIENVRVLSTAIPFLSNASDEFPVFIIYEYSYIPVRTKDITFIIIVFYLACETDLAITAAF